METQAMTIETESIAIATTIEQLLTFFEAPSNLERILPEGRFQDFRSNEESCNFKIQGGIEISLKLSQLQENFVEFKSGPNSPIEFTLLIHLKVIPGAIQGNLVFSAETNSFITMLIKNPLQSLFKDMGNNLKRVMEAGI
jgi:hypothetical protein